MYYIRAGYYTRAKSGGNIQWQILIRRERARKFSVTSNLREQPNKQPNTHTLLKKVKFNQKQNQDTLISMWYTLAKTRIKTSIKLWKSPEQLYCKHWSTCGYSTQVTETRYGKPQWPTINEILYITDIHLPKNEKPGLWNNNTTTLVHNEF